MRVVKLENSEAEMTYFSSSPPAFLSSRVVKLENSEGEMTAWGGCHAEALEARGAQRPSRTPPLTNCHGYDRRDVKRYTSGLYGRHCQMYEIFRCAQEIVSPSYLGRNDKLYKLSLRVVKLENSEAEMTYFSSSPPAFLSSRVVKLENSEGEMTAWGGCHAEALEARGAQRPSRTPPLTNCHGYDRRDVKRYTSGLYGRHCQMYEIFRCAQEIVSPSYLGRNDKLYKLSWIGTACPDQSGKQPLHTQINV